MLTLDKIYHAAFVLKDVARKTDLIEAPRLSKDCQLYLKTENLQVTGSFKVRGAYYKISQLSKEESDKGVIACSAGNHAQGVALAATRRGIKSIVCMPDGAPIMKVENTKNLGAEVCLVPGTYDDAHDKAVELQEETGMTFIHPYDDEQVIAGQGTIGLEILDQLPDDRGYYNNLDFVPDAWNQLDVWTVQDRMLLGIVGNQGINVNPVLSGWLAMEIPPMPPVFKLCSNVFILKLADGSMAALQLQNYQSTTGTKCCLTINYRYPL